MTQPFRTQEVRQAEKKLAFTHRRIEATREDLVILEKVRAEIAVFLLDVGRTQQQIADALKVERSTVAKWVARHKAAQS